MRFSRWFVLLLVVAAVVAGCASGGDLPPQISPREAQSRLQNDEDAILLDVRTVEEWANDGRSPAAVLIPLDELQARAPAELDPEATIMVICRSGNRSRTAADLLRQMGYRHVTEVEGGMRNWVAQGLPLECDVALCGLQG